MAEISRTRAKARIRYSVDDDLENGGVNESSPLISPVDGDGRGYGSSVRSAEVDIVPRDDDDSNPSAPSAPAAEHLDLHDLRTRQLFVRKVFAILAAQMTLFSLLTFVFVYIPHLRKIARQYFFDKVFALLSFSLTLLAIFVILCMWPGVRRKFAWVTLTLISVTIAYFLAYVMSRETALAYLFSTVASDTCCLGVVLSSFLPKVDITSRYGLLYYPTYMVVASAFGPSIVGLSVKKTIVPSLISTCLMSYLGYNTRSMIRNEELNLRPKEYVFGASQAFMNFDQIIKRMVRR